MRQLAWSLIPGGMSLVAASFFGSSWYLAEKIRSEALAVGPGPAMPAYDDVQFVGVSSEQAQLRAVGEQPILLKPMLCGIAWRGGIGHLGAAASVSGGVVTRPFDRDMRIGSCGGAGRCARQVVLPERSGNGVRYSRPGRSRTGPARATSRVVLPGIRWHVHHRGTRAERHPQGRAARYRHRVPHGISCRCGHLPQRPRRCPRPVRDTTGTGKQSGATSRRRCDGRLRRAPGVSCWLASQWARASSPRS